MKQENLDIYRGSTALTVTVSYGHRMVTQGAAGGGGRTVHHTGLLYTDIPWLEGRWGEVRSAGRWGNETRSAGKKYEQKKHEGYNVDCKQGESVCWLVKDISNYDMRGRIKTETVWRY